MRNEDVEPARATVQDRKQPSRVKPFEATSIDGEG
jgi:hypothetical protein